MKKINYLFLALFFAILLASCSVLDTTVDKTIEGSITTNTTWSESDTYIIKGDVYIDNSTLTIQPGTKIKFETGASLNIGYYNAATIIANGTVDKPIVFSSTAASPTPGAWKGIFLYDNCSSNSSFKYCQIKYAGAGTYDYGALNIDGTSCTFSNNTIQNAKGLGIRCYNNDSFFGEMNNNTISDCGGHALRIYAGKLHTIGTGNTFTTANGYGIVVSGSSVTGAVSWKKQTAAYYIEGEVDVDNSTLTIEAGTTLKFDVNGEIWVGYYNTATFLANGTSTSNIVFTSSATSPAAGAWKGIFFSGNNQANSSMTYCEVAYAGKSTGQAINIDNTSLTFNNNNVHHSIETGIDLGGTGSFVAMNNNTINNVGKHAMIISAKYFHTVGTGNTYTTSADMGIFLNGAGIVTACTWKKQNVDVIINSEVDIDNTLTIEAGSTFKFGAYGEFWVGYYNTAQLNAIGTSTSPIIFSAWSSTPAAGAWKGLYFDSHTSSNTTLDYCEFRYAGKGTNSDRAAVYIDGVTGMTIKNSKFLNSTGWGIYRLNSTLSAASTGNTFTSCALGNEGFN